MCCEDAPVVTDSLIEDPGSRDGARDLVFLSYSHTDAVWAQRLQVMLAPLMRPRRRASWIDNDRVPVGEQSQHGFAGVPGRRLELWVDTDRLQVGEVWRDELGAAIARSRVAVLLVSDH